VSKEVIRREVERETNFLLSQARIMDCSHKKKTEKVPRAEIK
jgi:hypothetical protein